MKRDDVFEFFRRLAEANPAPTTELEFTNPYTLLVAVVLSAQATDASVNAAMRPLFEDTGVLKIGHNLKFDWQIFAQRGIDISPYYDTMLMSYVVDSGRASHDVAALAKRMFDHTVVDFNEITKAGKTRVTFDCVPIERADDYLQRLIALGHRVAVCEQTEDPAEDDPDARRPADGEDRPKPEARDPAAAARD